MKNKQLTWMVTGVLLLLLLTGTVLAQIKSGTIAGTVLDPQDKRMPGVEVSILNEETNATITVTTNAVGEYMAPYLQAGRYSVTSKLAGFKQARITGIQIGTSETKTVDLRLEIGEIVETIEVRAEALRLQTESSTLQSSVSEDMIKALPNPTSNPFYFATLQPGVVEARSMTNTQDQNSFGIGFQGRMNQAAFSINGGNVGHNDIQLDGLSMMGAGWHDPEVLPSTEALQEVRTNINNFSAEYGRGQGVVSLTTKSGANQMHGTLFYRTRNEALNANTFQNNRTPTSSSLYTPRSPFKVHRYGATIGGPIKKDKIFYFGSWDGLSFKRGFDIFASVPTELEKSGDFSKSVVLVGSNYVPYNIYDPTSAVLVPGETDRYQRTQISDGGVLNKIPQNRLDPFIMKLMSNYPSPNRTPDNLANANNYYSRGQQKTWQSNFSGRLDFLLGKHTLYTSFGMRNAEIKNSKSWGEDNPFNNSTVGRGASPGVIFKDKNPYGIVGDTWTISPSLVADFRYQLLRVASDSRSPLTEGFDYDAFGIPMAFQVINPVPGDPPEWIWSSHSPIGTDLSKNSYNWKSERQTHHAFVASLIKMRNRWTHKFGVDHRIMLSNYLDPVYSMNINSNNADAGGPYVNGLGQLQTSYKGSWNSANYAGSGAAALMMGIGEIRVREGNNSLPALLQTYTALYTQNDWRVNSRLTINLGLRWDLQPGPTERYDQLSSIDLTQKNVWGTPGVFAFAGVNGLDRHYWDTEWSNFGPRLGAAYSLTDTIVLRGGYGLTYVPSNTGFFATPGMYGMGPWAVFTEESATERYSTLPGGVQTTPNGLPRGKWNQFNALKGPIGPVIDDPRLYGSIAEGANWRMDRHDWKNGRVQQWNLALEKTLGKAWLVSASYNGAHGDRLHASRIFLNSPQYITSDTLASWRNDYVASNGSVVRSSEKVPNPWQPNPTSLIPFRGTMGSATITRQESLNRYPLLGNLATQQSIGYSDYHAMILQIRRSFSNGLMLDVHYTRSKSIDMGAHNEILRQGFDDTGGSGIYDYLNLDNNRHISFSDIPHRFVATFLYELPFGAGKSVDLKNRFLNGILRGWKISGAGQAKSGQPLQISGSANGALNGRPDRLEGVPIEVPKELQRWYNGKTSVTLPSGHVIKPAANTFLKYNPDAFKGRTVQAPNGKYLYEQYWWGSSPMAYEDLRGNGMNNWNLSVQRTFGITERIKLELSAMASNFFNHTQFLPGINGGLGNTIIDSGKGPIGYSESNNFGAYSDATYPAREIEINLRLRF